MIHRILYHSFKLVYIDSAAYLKTIARCGKEDSSLLRIPFFLVWKLYRLVHRDDSSRMTLSTDAISGITPFHSKNA